MSSFDLTNHVVLVTGGNHGIGTATARFLGDCGAQGLVSTFPIYRPPSSGNRRVSRLRCTSTY